MLVNAFAEKSGIRITEMGERAQRPKDRLYNCFIKGFLIFLVSYALNMLFVTSFDLPCSRLVVAAFAIILSVFSALFYYNRLCFNLGFVGLFLLFLPLAFALVGFANSGMNAILNIVLEAVDKKLNLEGVRLYQEFYSNRTLTITCCLVLMLFLETCFLNAFISEHMSGILVFVFCYPVIQICMYLCDDVSWVYVAIILFVVVACFVLKRSKRFRPILLKNYPGCVIKKGKITYTPASERESSTLVKVIALIFPVFIGVYILAVMGLQMFPYTARNNVSAWKSSTDEAVAEFAMHGVAGYFNSYNGAGGMSHGRLGGVREVFQDFETDLKVRYVPYSTDVVYLKSFIGTTYYKNQWTQHIKGSIPEFFRYEYQYLEDMFLSAQQPSSIGLMQTIIMDSRLYKDRFYPDYTADPDTVINEDPFGFPSTLTERYTGLPVTEKYLELEKHTNNATSDYLFSPLLSENTLLSCVRNDDPAWEKYRKSMYSDMYLKVPEDIQPLIQDICTEQNFHGEPLEIVGQIQNYFRNNFVYSLAPGKTPNNRDFVRYFLAKQKKGYCTHFASAGVMFLRQMGIPAVYVEGYAIDIETAADASDILDNESVSEWYFGDNLLVNGNEEVPVLEVELTDAQAHAWVMIFLDDFGWYPVELTTARMEAGTSDDFWSNFGRFFTGDDNNTNPVLMLTEQAKKIGSGFVKLILILAGTGFVLLTVSVARRKFRLYIVSNNTRLSNQYVVLNSLLNRYYLEKKQNVFHLDSVEIGKELGMDEEELTTYASLTERASYGKDNLSNEELRSATKIFKKYIKKLRENIKGSGKFFILFRI